ncbi:MAG: hypothetical protein WKF59_00590 [Chitinophagaceae bacterium]
MEPDGKQLAFVRTVDSRPQIFILPMEGGEARQFTRNKNGASNPKWSPDGKNIVFSSSISLSDYLKDSLINPTHSLSLWAYEKPGFDKNENLKSSNAKSNPDGNMEEIEAYLDKNEIDKKARVITKLNFQDESNISSETNFTQYFITASTGYSKTKTTYKSFYRFNNVDFTPDGKSC